MFQSKLPKIFWSYVVIHSVFLINCLPSPVILVIKSLLNCFIMKYLIFLIWEFSDAYASLLPSNKIETSSILELDDAYFLVSKQERKVMLLWTLPPERYSFHVMLSFMNLSFILSIILLIKIELIATMIHLNIYAMMFMMNILREIGTVALCMTLRKMTSKKLKITLKVISWEGQIELDKPQLSWEIIINN